MENENYKLKFFPLGVILLKGEQTYLHVFEPKYLQLLKDCMAKDKVFGIPFVVDGKMTRFGSKVMIKKIVRTYPNGTFDILIEGLSNFDLLKIIENIDDKLYFTGLVEEHTKQVKSGITLTTLFQGFLEKTDEILDGDVDKSYHLDDIAVCLSMNLNEKYNYISSIGHYAKEAFLVNKIRFLLFLGELDCKMEHNFSLN